MHIALIRGINVGGNNIVPMKELRDLLETNGYENVRTYIQSGNIVFDQSRDDAVTISELIESKFGFKPSVLLLTKEAFDESITNCPFQTDEGKTLHFFFCHNTPEEVDYDLLESVRSPTEHYKLIDKVFYLHAPDGIGRSKLAAKVERAFKGVSMTGRNMNTIHKIRSMVLKSP